MLFLKKRRKISKFSYTICHGARFVHCPGLARLLKQTTLISIERLISTPRLIHFNNLKISQLQRHLHGEGKKWVGQNRQNENATDCDLFFVSVLTVVVVVVTFVHSFHFKSTTTTTTTTTIISLFLIDCVCCAQGLLWFAGTFCTCEQILSARMMRVCVCQRNPFALYFSSTSHFF